MKEHIVQILKLVLICVISAAILALVYGVTKEPIEKSKANETIQAVKSVIKGFTDDMTISDTIIEYKNTELKIFNVFDKDKNIVGRSIITHSHNGYGGDVFLMVGINNQFEISGVYILEHKETPGLGSKMDTDEFKNQFLKKSLKNFIFKVKKDGGDVDAITSATITSRAVSEAIELGLEALQNTYMSQMDNKEEIKDNNEEDANVN